jgi:hypothetical protein
MQGAINTTTENQNCTLGTVKKQTKLLFKTEKKHGKIQQRKTKQAR